MYAVEMAAKEIITHNSITKQKKTRVCSASRKLDNYCISRIVATEEVKSEKVEAYYISTHTNHTLGIDECKHLPLPPSVKTNIQQEFVTGKSLEKIMDGNFYSIYL